MGSSSSKPRSPNRVRDSVVLCDGYAKMHQAKHAVSGDGRYVFVLGNMHVSCHPRDTSLDEFPLSFELDVIDLFLSRRTRIGSIGDLYNLGHPTGFYAIDERTVVLVDYDLNDNTLRQRLIHVDLMNETAECTFYRGYAIEMSSLFHMMTSTGEECAVTVLPSLVGSPQSGIVYPMNPLSSKPHKEITTLIDGANALVRQFYEAGEAGEAKVSTFHPPFFISSTVLGFFIDPNNVDDLIDPMKVVVMNLTTGAFYLQETKSSVAFPLSADRSRPAYAKWIQSSNREVALVTRYRRTSGWQVHVASALLTLFRWSVYAALLLMSWQWRRLGRFCVHASMRMLMLRADLMEPRTEQFTGFGTLNTRTLEWSEIKATVWDEDETSILPVRDGHFVVASQANSVDSSRLIGLDSLVQKKMERFRLIGNPLNIPSLTRLSSIAVQKNARVPTVLLEQIAARIL